MPIRYHLDENIHGDVARGLRSRGVDITTPAETDLIAAPDESHLRFASAEQRVFVTHDADLLRLAASGINHAGMVYCHIHAHRPREIIRALIRLWRTKNAEEMLNQIEFI